MYYLFFAPYSLILEISNFCGVFQDAMTEEEYFKLTRKADFWKFAHVAQNQSGPVLDSCVSSCKSFAERMRRTVVILKIGPVPKMCSLNATFQTWSLSPLFAWPVVNYHPCKRLKLCCPYDLFHGSGPGFPVV